MKLYTFVPAAGLLTVSLLSAGVQAQQTELTISADAQAVFDLAQELYPDLFGNGSELREAQGYIYRLFADSGIFVGVKDESISLLGGPFGNSIVSKGSIDDLLLVLEGIKADLDLQPSADVEALFDMAADLYPEIFVDGSGFMTSADGYLYQYFADSGVYAAVKDGAVYLKGGAFGTVYTSRGELNAVLDRLEELNDNGEIPEIPEGDFTLTVSGTYSISGPVAITQPFNFVFEDMPAPDSSDQDEIEDAFLDSLEDVEGFVITDFDYVVINDSADHIEFDINVAGTMASQAGPINMTYDLHYDYVK